MQTLYKLKKYKCQTGSRILRSRRVGFLCNPLLGKGVYKIHILWVFFALLLETTVWGMEQTADYPMGPGTTRQHRSLVRTNSFVSLIAGKHPHQINGWYELAFFLDSPIWFFFKQMTHTIYMYSYFIYLISNKLFPFLESPLGFKLPNEL